MKLNEQQQAFIYNKLLEKEELIAKREANREMVRELNRAWKTASDMHTRRDFKQREQVGIRIIEAQTARLKALAMHRLADELGCDVHSVKYYDRCSGIVA